MFEVIVVEKRQEAEGICCFELRREDGQSLPGFTAGAHIDVQVSTTITRQYSLCNSPLERDRYLIAVLHEPLSRGGSRGMHEAVGVGDRLWISTPKNHFPLTACAGKSVLLGGGIGITPVLAMAFQLAHEGAEFELHYCVREPRRAAFLQQMAASGFADSVHLHFDSGEQDQRLDVNHVLAAPDADTHLYVCGPKGFMDHVINAAHRLGWPTGQIHREYFAAPVVAHDVDHAFEVELADRQTRHVVRWAARLLTFRVIEVTGLNAFSIHVSKKALNQCCSKDGRDFPTWPSAIPTFKQG